MWFVAPDGMPNEKYAVFNSETGDTLKTDKAPGWFRTSSIKKAQKKVDRLNKGGIAR